MSFVFRLEEFRVFGLFSSRRLQGVERQDLSVEVVIVLAGRLKLIEVD